MNSYDNPWFFGEEPFLGEGISDFEGFVYMIINKLDGRKYIGRKYFWSRTKKKGSARRSKSESDWKDYYGSSEDLKKDIDRLGKENFDRIILSLHKTKGGCNYTEIEEQVNRQVLFDDTYYNKFVFKYRMVNRQGDISNPCIHTEEWRERQSKFMSEYNKNVRWINNGEKNKKIPKNEKLPEGWFEGKFFSQKEKFLRKDKIQKKWAEGSYENRNPRSPFTEEQKQKAREQNLGKNNPRYGKKNSKEHTEKIIKAIKGTKWVHRGTERKRIKIDEVEKYLSLGYQLGKGKHR